MKVEILGISTKDSFYSDRQKIVGLDGDLITHRITKKYKDGSMWVSGKLMLKDPDKYQGALSIFFYKIKVKEL